MIKSILAYLLLFIILAADYGRVVGNEQTRGLVHLWRDRQMLAGNVWAGPFGRVTANKWLAAFELWRPRVLQIFDLNILFFAGHPNERVGIIESTRVNWWLLPFFAYGLWKIKLIWFKKILPLMAVGAVFWALRFPVLETQALWGSALLAYVISGWGIYQLWRRK